MDSTIIHCDNQSYVKLYENLEFHDKSKHIEIKCHYIKDMVRKLVCWRRFFQQYLAGKVLSGSPLNHTTCAKFRLLSLKVGAMFLEKNLDAWLNSKLDLFLTPRIIHVDDTIWQKALLSLFISI